MIRRSTPQAKIDQSAFPVVLRVLVPENGFAQNDPSDWLRRDLGPSEFATTSFSSSLGDAMAFHFRGLDNAHAFRVRVPTLVLAGSALSNTFGI